MPTKIFVGRIAEGTPSEEIRALFKKFGVVTECDVISNYGFVHMDTEEEAKAAIASLDGYSINGSHIHVELSTAGTQGRKKRGFNDNFRGGRGGGGGGDRGGGRYEPYPPRRDNYMNSGGGPDMDRGGRGGPPPLPDRGAPNPREEYASEQVKDLLELYFRDPYAFDQYARTYYYGERSERVGGAGPPQAAGPPPGGPRGYYDKRPGDGGGYPPSRREDEMRGGGYRGGGGYGPPPSGYDNSRMMRDDRGGNPYYK